MAQNPSAPWRAAAVSSGAADVVGLSGAARGLAALRLLEAGTGRRTLLAVAVDEEEADLLARDLAFFLGAGGPAGPAVVRVPADPVLPYDDLSPDRGLEMDRLAALARLHLSGAGVRAVVVSARALARRHVPRSELERNLELLGKGATVDRDGLARRLTEIGYARVPLVEDPGTFAVRGSVVDVWSPLHDRPVRLELFGDEVESARAFEPGTQRSLSDVDELVVVQAREAPFTEGGKAAAVRAVRELAEKVARPTSKVREVIDAIESGTPFFGMEALLPGFHEGALVTLLEHLPDSPALLVDDPEGVERALSELDAELDREHAAALRRDELALPPEAHFLRAAQVASLLRPLPALRCHRVFLGTAEPVRFALGDTAAIRGEIEAAHGDEGALSPLVRRLQEWRSRGVTAVVATHSPSSADRLRRLLEDRRLGVRIHAAPPGELRSLWDPAVHVHLVPGDLSHGFVDLDGGVALVADEEILGRRVRKRARSARIENAMVAGFRDLNEGDLVVHVEHGIARYGGLTKMQIRGVEGDFLVLQYEGADRLYLPVAKLRQVQKFTGAAPDAIRLDRLGGSSFALRKARVKEQLLKMAAELLDIYAARAAHHGFAFAAPDEIFREFEAEFPYEETPDQAKAIGDVIADMTKGRAEGQGGTPSPRAPMDRLVCGDVGYGKTEVALRAAMLAVLSRKQVAVLVPTTVLASQHERTFRERFSGYPVRVEAISRMRTPEEVRKVLAETAAGKVDVLVGTHRLLATDVSFRDLGLVVVDEEQRFGVTHKERLKKLRKLVDVLTLTATPIPRTLHMSLAGVRDMSIIATPPEDRRSIRTFVAKFDPVQIKDAIEQELRRGGQVYFVHNRVRSIHSMEKFLRELVPQARIGVAHGQMGEGKLEEVMSRFVVARVRRAARHLDHRERPRHPHRQHHHREPRRSLRPGAALPDPRPRRPQPGAGLRLSLRPLTPAGDEGRAAAARGPAEVHRPGQRLRHRQPRSGNSRRREPARQGPVGADRGGGIRPLLRAHGRGGAGAARGGAAPRHGPGRPAAGAGLHPRWIHARRPPAALLLQAARPGLVRRGARGGPRRDRGPLRRHPRRARRTLRAHGGEGAAPDASHPRTRRRPGAAGLRAGARRRARPVRARQARPAERGRAPPHAGHEARRNGRSALRLGHPGAGGREIPSEDSGFWRSPSRRPVLARGRGDPGARAPRGGAPGARRARLLRPSRVVASP